nr:putative 7 protein [Infectious bronchitis virus]
MDLLHLLVHFVKYYFCALLSIITGIDCEYVQYLSFFWLLFFSVVLLLCFLLLCFFFLFFIGLIVQ